MCTKYFKQLLFNYLNDRFSPPFPRPRRLRAVPLFLQGRGVHSRASVRRLQSRARSFACIACVAGRIKKKERLFVVYRSLYTPAEQDGGQRDYKTDSAFAAGNIARGYGMILGKHNMIRFLKLSTKKSQEYKYLAQQICLFNI